MKSSTIAINESYTTRHELWLQCTYTNRYNDMWYFQESARLVGACWYISCKCHYSDVITSAMASQITSLTIVHLTVYSGADQINIKAPRHWPLCGKFIGHRWIPRTQGLLVTRKMFPFDDVIMTMNYQWFRKSLGTYSTPSHYLTIKTYSQLYSTEQTSTKLEWNDERNTSENVVCKMAASLLKPRVKFGWAEHFMATLTISYC